VSLIPVGALTHIDYQRDIQLRRLLHMPGNPFDQRLDIIGLDFEDQLIVNLHDHSNPQCGAA